MEPNILSISSDSNNVRKDVFPFGQWLLTTKKGIILQSKCTCQQGKIANQEPAAENSSSTPREVCNICKYTQSLPQLYTMPDMLFNDNLLRLEHRTGVGIEFNALDALKLVEETKDPLQVAVADGWQSARADFPFAKSVVKPFDWTFTTDYRGSLVDAIKHKRQQQYSQTSVAQPSMSCVNQSLSSTKNNSIEDTKELSNEMSKSTCLQTHDDQSSFKIEETDERIDVNKLKVREEILFYDDVTLYEDELADHGTAQYSVKVRVMPKSLFILARFYLRVDGVLARINDTRIYHELGKRYLLREYTNREAKLLSLNLPVSTQVNPNELMHHLPIMHSCYEKLSLPNSR